MVKEIDEEAFVKEMIVAGAPKGADPATVMAFASEMARATAEGPLTASGVRAITRKYPRLRQDRSSDLHTPTPKDLKRVLENSPLVVVSRETKRESAMREHVKAELATTAADLKKGLEDTKKAVEETKAQPVTNEDWHLPA
jgi:hypothetical protein